MNSITLLRNIADSSSLLPILFTATVLFIAFYGTETVVDPNWPELRSTLFPSYST